MNEARARAKQIERINRGHTFTGHRFDPKYGVVIPGQWVGPNGQRSGLSPVERDIVYGAVVKPVKTVANLGINVAQRATNGWKPADPASTPVGRVINQADRQIKGGMGIKQDEQRKPEDLFWQQMGEMASTSVVGGIAAQGLVPAAAFTTGAFKALAPGAQQALRWTAGVGTESVISTALTDNRQGNVANAFGENAPMAIKPDDDMVSALGKSLIPNAGAEISLGLGFLGLGKAVGRGLEGFDNVRRRQAEGRAAQETTDARNFTKEAGLQDEVDGEHGFTQQATQPTPAAAAPEAAPVPEAAPAAPPTKQQAEDELLGPKEQPAETAAAPIEEPEYSPELPEVDTAVMAAGRLDDDQLIATAQGTGPVLPELERQLAEQRAGFQPQEGLTPDLVAAPTENLAKPTVPYEDQWSQLPNQTLFSLASPANNPELFDIVSKMTGRSYEEFTWTDVVDGLKVLQEQGTTVLPDRVMNGSGMSKTSELSVNAPLFQYKDNVNAQGQQKGNSLEGVTKWNPDLEQVNLVWDNPADGQTYMINGHNSLAKAKELGIPTIPTKRILANTPGEARLIGAKANIASGGGTAFDAAKIIRELGIQDAAGLEAAGIPLDSGLGTSGLALSKLPDDLFQQTINGELGMGRALALGGSGLDPADMIRVAGLGGKKEISERGFAELVQMASSAPKVADADQGGIPGMDEWLKDSSVIEKAELSAKVRAELINSKNLFGKVGKNKAAQKLADKGGTQVNQEQVTSAADIAKAVLDEFDRDKYLANTPISELLNQGASDIAAGAKPAVIAKRILQQLETAAEAAPPAVKAPVEEPAPAAPAEPAPLTAAQRKQLKAQVVKRAIENGEVRPSATPLPDLPDPPKDLNDPAALIADEARLAQEYGTQDVIADQLALDAKRQAMGWSDMSLEQKKASGMLDEWQRPQEPVGDSLEDRAAYAREQRIAAEAAGDTTLAREWQNAERQLERDRIAQSQQRQATSQPDMFGVGKYDDSTPLLNETPPAPEPGVKRFFHGSASEFKLVEGGEFEGGEMNIYGTGLYTTDSLNIAGKYQKKNKVKGAQADGVTYEVVEKKPVKFFDLDAPATPDVLNKLRDVAGYDSMTELVETAINELDGTPSLTQVFDEMRAWSRQLEVPAHEIQSTWHELSLALEKDGYGGFTHQGGHLAGRGKELHQVRIYWDPANSVDIYKVDADGNRVAVEAKEGPSITPGFTAADRAKVKGDVAITPAERLASLEERLVLAKKANNQSLVESIEKVLPGLRKEAGASGPAPAGEVAQTMTALTKGMLEGPRRQMFEAYKSNKVKLSGVDDPYLNGMQQLKAKGITANTQEEFNALLDRVIAERDRRQAAAPAIEIPEAASRKITDRTDPGRIEFAAQSLFNWTTSADPGVKPAFRSVEEALAAVRAKGRILDPDAIPGLDMVKAREDQARGLGFTPTSQAVSDAFKQFYGVKPDALSPLSDLDEEAAYLGLRAGPLPFMDMPTSEAVKTRRIMEGVFTDAVRRITGKEDVAFHGYTDRVIKPSEHGGDGVRTGTRNGFYDPMTDMVNVMGLMDRSPGEIVETVVHESWHRIQYTLLTLKDMEIFDSVFGKIRINDLASMRSANGKASLEKQAYAAQVVAADKAKGLDASMEGVRIGLVEAMDDQFPLKDGRSWGNTLRGEVGIRVIQGIYKVMDLIERVNNGIRGRGYETVQSMFEKAYSGELAKTRAWDSVAQLTTPDQKARLAKLEEWRKDNRKGISEINQMVASIDEQINALKSQAMKGGC